MKQPEVISARALVVRLLMLTSVIAMAAFVSAQTSVKPADDIPAANQIQAADLVQAMKSAQKPLVLYVGPKAFYAQGHIPGSEFIGPVGKPEGMEKLRARIAALPKDSAVVIYCGCCPWDHCPNIRPAFAEMKKEGFSNVSVLYIQTGLGPDWKDKGLPFTSGE